VETAILEVFGDQWIKDRQVSLNDLKSYDVCEIEVRRSFQVVDATGKNLNRHGLGALDANFFATTEYAITQEWANALMTHPQAPAGIRYNSRKNPAHQLRSLRFSCREVRGAASQAVSTSELQQIVPLPFPIRRRGFVEGLLTRSARIGGQPFGRRENDHLVLSLRLSVIRVDRPFGQKTA
jgi:hypothetical protein